MEQEKIEEKLKWTKQTKLNVDKLVTPMVNDLLLVIEEEKKRTEQQIKDVKKLLERIQNA